MQAVLRRTQMAERQAARRLAKRKTKYDHQMRKTRREQENFVQREAKVDIKLARQVRREDYELGPLAPKRDVGAKKDTYGTIHTNRIRGEELTMEERLRLNPSGGKYSNIVVNDRVVLLEGRDKGRIGKVVSIDRARQEITVEGLNMIDIAVPKWMINADEGDQRPVRSMEKPVSLAAVKLVVPLPDATTGTVRDVIVRDIVNGPVFHDRTTGRKHWTRFIAGLNTPIPWPKIEPKEHKEHDCDTLRLDVEAQSFVPSLLKPPMPGSVIDELRNKFSKFRTRHEESYLLKKIEEEREKEERKKSIKLMRTPINEINRRERKLRKAKGKGKLTAEMLARIGAVIAKKKEAALAAAGLSPATF